MTPTHNIFRGRPDTMLGICEAVGQDIGISPNLLRVTLGVALLFNPVAVIASYLGMGVVVLVSRMIWPSRPARLPVPAAAPIVAHPQRVNDAVEHELALAA